MIDAMQDIRDVATQIQAESSIHDTRQKKLQEIIDIADEAINYFTDDGR